VAEGEKAMKRRGFLAAGMTGAVAAGFSGCAGVAVKQELAPHAFDRTAQKPSGTMPTGEIGKTGIKVSRFGFGSHIRQDIVPFTSERERMVRDAHELGITLFDVYDKEGDSFQYAPMGKYLKPVINDVAFSITLTPWDGRSFEEQLAYDLKQFGREYLDMVRIHSWKSADADWKQWDSLFKWKEQGKIRAVGIPIHNLDDIREPLEKKLPLDYVIFPFNFYHNWTWLANEQKVGRHDTFGSLVAELRKRNIGVVSMKPFAGDYLVTPFGEIAREYDPEVNLAQACLKYVINSGLNVDTTLGGMYYPYQVRENVEAYYNPMMTGAERAVLKKLRKRAKVVADRHLPPHYRFLSQWAPDNHDDADLERMG
jgi:predicted aldo/keto reductase-like oxidoreductase